MTFLECSSCGQAHDISQMAFDVPCPDYLFEIPEAERPERCELQRSVCVIDDEKFFVKGALEIPVSDLPQPLSLNVWVSLSSENFDRSMELWTTVGRESEPPYFGWFSNRLPGFPDTLNLKTLVHTQPVGSIPLITLEPSEHPLSVAHHKGLSESEYKSLVMKLLHGQ